MVATINAQFRRILVASTLEQATMDTLVMWLPTYLAEVERQLNLHPSTLPAPQNYTNRNSFDTLAGEQIPKIVVLSEGIEGIPVTFGPGQYQAVWRLGVGVATSAKDERTANMYVKAYGAAIRALMVQQGLGNEVAGVAQIRWAGETYNDLPLPNQHMLFKAASLFFLVDVEDVVTWTAGPTVPIAPPHLPQDYPNVEEVFINLQKVDEIT
jgi:hypothetical protein